MMRNDFLFTTVFLSLLVVSSSFLPHADVLGPLDSIVDSLMVKDTSTLSRNHKIRFLRCRLLSSKISGKENDCIPDANSNTTEKTESDITQNETKTKGYYRPIEEWHEETHDPKHVILQLKQEKARWKETFGDMEK